MSLRIFHIIFVSVCVALSAFVAAWGMRQWTTSHNTSGLVLGIIFLIAGFGMIEYGRRVYRKLKDLP